MICNFELCDESKHNWDRKNSFKKNIHIKKEVLFLWALKQKWSHIEIKVRWYQTCQSIKSIPYHESFAINRYYNKIVKRFNYMNLNFFFDFILWLFHSFIHLVAIQNFVYTDFIWKNSTNFLWKVMKFACLNSHLMFQSFNLIFINVNWLITWILMIIDKLLKFIFFL